MFSTDKQPCCPLSGSRVGRQVIYEASAGLPISDLAQLPPIVIQNNCNKPIRIWLDWKKATGEWSNGRGPWQFEPSERAPLGSSDVQVRTKNLIFYYYAV
jgi:hypothetical protein